MKKKEKDNRKLASKVKNSAAGNGHQTGSASRGGGFDPRGVRKMDAQARPLGSLPAGIKFLQDRPLLQTPRNRGILLYTSGKNTQWQEKTEQYIRCSDKKCFLLNKFRNGTCIFLVDSLQ